MTPREDNVPAFAEHGINLASSGLGAKGIFVTDEFFAPLERMLADKPAIFLPDKYDDHGKWMDGWESRRKRSPGHDFAVIRLAAPGRILGFEIDTAHFTGNYPPECSVEACYSETDPDERTHWTEVVPKMALGPSARHFAECNEETVFNHVRLHIYPDGGIARLRVYGRPRVDVDKNVEIDLAAALTGGRVIAYSDAHYGAVNRILAPGRGLDMGDGWETRRRRTPGNDWIIVALGLRGVVGHVLVDTCHYKGNYPAACSIDAVDLGDTGAGMGNLLVSQSTAWKELLGRRELGPDAVHEFDDVNAIGPVTHVRLNIFPDGGISRLRLFGKRA
jgi:allantoicase